MFKWFAGSMALLLLAQCSSLGPRPENSQSHFKKEYLFPTGKNRLGRTLESYVASGKQVMVASEGAPATQIALDVLKRGGNAVDAAIALSFAISVYRPQSTGIGGGGFLVMYREKDRQTTVLDMRERAPQKATRDMYLRNGKVVPQLSRVGALSVGVPGLVAGLETAYKKYASKKIPWKDLVLPAAKLARQGFPVYERLARSIEWLDKEGLLKKFPATKKLLSRPDGRPLQLGDRYRNRNLAKTLEVIAKKGAKGFYSGWVAKEIVRSVRKQGGLIRLADLKAYRTKERPAIRGQYNGYEIHSMPPPSSGGVHIVQMLNMLENHKNVLQKGFNHPDVFHLKAEVMRRAYADRSQFLGDPDFFKVPVKGLISKAYAAQLAGSIDLDQAKRSQSQVKPGTPSAFEKTTTTHFSIVDANGMAVASTQTINYTFGSAMVAGNTGIFLNNEMDDFSAQPGVPNLFGLVGGEANAIAPGKTPLSSMSPTIVTRNGKVRLVLGSPGGSQIISSVWNVIVNMIDHQMALPEAVSAPRVHHQWLPDKLFYDKGGLALKTRQWLEKKGHVLQERDWGIGNVSAVSVNPETGEKTGVSDPRRGGAPQGY